MYLGNISKFNSAKGHITLTLNEDLAIGDTIYTENESVIYTVSELMHKTLNLSEAQSGLKVTIGRMKGNIAVGDKVYKLTSKNLLNSARLSYTNCENRKININANVIVIKAHLLVCLLTKIINLSLQPQMLFHLLLSHNLLQPTEL